MSSIGLGGDGYGQTFDSMLTLALVMGLIHCSPRTTLERGATLRRDDAGVRGLMDTVGVLGVAGLGCTASTGGATRFAAPSGVDSMSDGPAADEVGVRRPRARASGGTIAGKRFFGATSGDNNLEIGEQLGHGTHLSAAAGALEGQEGRGRECRATTAPRA